MSSATPNFDQMQDAAREAHKVRKKYMNALRYGEITFPQFIMMSKEKGYESLSKVRVVDLLASFPGWSSLSAQSALTANGILAKTTVAKCREDEDCMEIVGALAESSSSRWQQRVKAPDGWPWFGNLYDTLIEMEDTELPREIVQARYSLEGAEEAVSEDISHTRKVTPDEDTDSLDDLLGDDDDDDDSLIEDAEEDEGDALDKMFGDDDDDDLDFEDYLNS